MVDVSSNKKQAGLEYDALGDLGEHVANILGLSPLTKAMVNQQIASIQETLYLAWGLDPTGVDPGFFQIEANLLQQHAVQMKTNDGQWVQVNYGALEQLPADVTIRLLYYDNGKETFYEANGRTEFLLAVSPLIIEDTSIWSINYQTK